MQLGTSWTAGEEPPASVPPSLRAAITGVDAAVLTGSDGRPAPRWTLTWLEGRPIAELDTGVFVRLDEDGEAFVEHDDGDEFG